MLNDSSKSMQDTNERFCREVIAKKDFSQIDHIYTSAARVLPPGAQMIQGRDAIKEFWKTAIATMGITGANLKSIEVEVTGDTAVELGEAELRLGEGAEVSAKYLVHWKYQGGEWLWDKDIWNTN